MICIPITAPGLADGGVFAVPFGFEFTEISLGNLHGFGPIDGLEIGGYFLAVLPGHKTQAVTHQMHDASLDLGLREYAVE